MSHRIPHPPPPRRTARTAAGAAVLIATIAIFGMAAVPRAAQAQAVNVTTTLTGLTYGVSIFDGKNVEVGEVDFTFPTDPVLTNLSAPNGYFINYDQPSGSLAIGENTAEILPGSTVGTFFFTASSTITPKVIEGLDDNGDSLPANNGISFPTASGQSRTTGLGGLAATPEPGSLGLLALGATTGLACLQRVGLGRRRTMSTVTKG